MTERLSISQIVIGDALMQSSRLFHGVKPVHLASQVTLEPPGSGPQHLAKEPSLQVTMM